ncbi:DUF814 domain-containing protein, partial [Candidatus Woesearchaeota archaeon]
MDIVLSVRKSIEKSAGEYFDRAKKLRKKAQGARETAQRYEKKLATLEKKREKILKEKKEVEKVKRTAPIEWYEKFRWFKSSEGFLCIGGRDATTNEILIKKHTEPFDVVFHAEMAGSPFFIVKTQGKTPGD